jgi:hypothetical protein
MSTTMNKLLLIAALVSSVPAVAHAEFMAKPKSDVHDVRAPAAKVGATPLTVDTMLAKIQSSYISRMRRCYNKGLARNPTLAGIVTLTFTVNRYGRVDGEAVGITPKVDRCLTSALSSWRFPTTTARKEATFRLSVSLQK